MIEKRIRNDLTLKRWRRFKSRRTAFLSIWVFLGLLFVSITAELWANNKPLLMKFGGKLYAPVIFNYRPKDFGSAGLETDYRAIRLNEGDWALWPPVRWSPIESNRTVADWPSPPSSENILGTDDRGRDVFARLLYGFRYSFGYALSVWIFTSVLGIVLGAIMGFFGGWVDLLGQRAIEVIESMPWLLLLLIIISIFPPDLWLLIAFTSIFGWIGTSLYIRAEFLKLRKREFVEAAVAAGSPWHRIVFKHVLPNSLTPWLTMSPFLISGNIAGLAALDYLGFGLRPPTPSWGELLSQAQQHFTVAWWLAVFPSLALFITLVVLNLIGEGARDALDPRN